MQRFGLKTLLLLITVVTLGYWWFDDGYHKVYSVALSDKYKLTIYSRVHTETNELDLRVTYHYPPAFGMVAVSKFKVRIPETVLKFSLVTDDKTGIRCVFDENDLGLLFLYSPVDKALWSSGQSFEPKLVEQFRDIKIRNPGIPYDDLPMIPW